MLRAVADTNVYVSALNFGGAADRVLEFGRIQHIQLFVSPPIVEEIEGVLIHKFRWSRNRVREARAAIRGFTRLVSPRVTIDLLAADEPDNRILECAVEANAHIIVTGDKHLQALGSFRGISIVSPRQFLDALPTPRPLP